jgi:hypothetical protein
MSYQGYKVRGWAFGLVAVGMVAGLAGCKTAGGEQDGGGGPKPMVRPSFASFAITKSAIDPGLLVVSPDDGDAWLETLPRERTHKDEQINGVVWTYTESFDIKFVQIDDPDKSPTRKFGPTQQNGWTAARCEQGKPCVFDLPLYKGNGKSKKEIRGAKYMVRSPSDCDHRNPGAGCAFLDPVLIVRY